MRQTFEFYCNDCHGYILVRLSMVKDQNILVVCPNCRREHPRVIKGGELKSELFKDKHGFYCYGDDRYANNDVLSRNHMENTGERILPMKSAYSKERRLHVVEKAGFMAERWLEKAEREKHG